MKKISSLIFLSFIFGIGYSQKDIGLYIQVLEKNELPSGRILEGGVLSNDDGLFIVFIDENVDNIMLFSDKRSLSVYYDSSVILNIKQVIYNRDTIETNSFLYLTNPYFGYKVHLPSYRYYYSGIEKEEVTQKDGPVLVNDLFSYWLNKDNEVIVRNKPLYKSDKRIYFGHFNLRGKLSSIYYTGFERHKLTNDLIIEKQALLFRVDSVDLTGFPRSFVKTFSRINENELLVKQALYKDGSKVYLGYFDVDGNLESITYLEYKVIGKPNKIVIGEEILLLLVNESPIFEYEYYDSPPVHPKKN